MVKILRIEPKATPDGDHAIITAGNTYHFHITNQDYSSPDLQWAIDTNICSYVLRAYIKTGNWDAFPGKIIHNAYGQPMLDMESGGATLRQEVQPTCGYGPPGFPSLWKIDSIVMENRFHRYGKSIPSLWKIDSIVMENRFHQLENA